MHKISLLFLLTAVLRLSAQQYARDWHQQYNPKDTNYGIGLQSALKTIPVPAGARTVVVAVIDDGTDVDHPDLKDNIWVNVNEIPGNAVDDDHNGYIDDIHGWDYLGNLAADIEYDNLELTRLLRDYQTRFGGKSAKEIPKNEKGDYKTYKKIESAYQKELKQAQKDYENIQIYNKLCNALIEELDSSNISLKDLTAFSPKSVEAKYGYAITLNVCGKTGMPPKQFFDEVRQDYERSYEKLNYHLNLEFDSRKQVGDYYQDHTSLGYGNQDVKGPDGMHGSHVAGIIAAVRNNGFGVDGIAAPLVKIMVLRVVPNGDERDKDVAHAIRYAADNGAKVINMSFGKYYAYHSEIVKAAIRYAESKDVLMVHAAGNENKNNDKTLRYPSAEYQEDSFCKTWIEVGASDRDQQPADFSNYGKGSVDVFAPGVQIYSTISNGRYKYMDGTSMASPVVAGLAALIRAYYPKLSAIQVKQIIESTVVKPEKKVRKPGKKRKKTKYKKLCKTAGIVNAENALKAAAAL